MKHLGMRFWDLDEIITACEARDEEILMSFGDEIILPKTNQFATHI